PQSAIADRWTAIQSRHSRQIGNVQERVSVFTTFLPVVRVALARYSSDGPGRPQQQHSRGKCSNRADTWTVYMDNLCVCRRTSESGAPAAPSTAALPSTAPAPSPTGKPSSSPSHLGQQPPAHQFPPWLRSLPSVILP